MEGKVIPIRSSPFLIGRSPECQLRPASVLVSMRHCAVLLRDNQAFIRDLDSTNGTFVNGEPVRGEHPLLDGNHLKVGPLEFRIALETASRGSEPMPVAGSQDSADEETAAALLLSSQDQERLPEGSTIIESRPEPSDSQRPQEEELQQDNRHRGAALGVAAAKGASGNTAAAAQAILDACRRRRR
jgi:pSer/pThr/pTyr-binding forkhead associated (FHA) protein